MDANGNVIIFFELRAHEDRFQQYITEANTLPFSNTIDYHYISHYAVRQLVSKFLDNLITLSQTSKQ